MGRVATKRLPGSAGERQRNARVLLATALLLSAGLFSSVAQESPVRSGHQIVPGDQVRIAVEEQPSLNRVYPVAGDGTVDLGLIGRVLIAGETLDAAAEKIRTQLEERYFKTATVSVEVAEYVEGNVLVMGAVGSPKSIVVTSDSAMTLVEAISACGGLAREANGAEVRILRWKPGAGMERETIIVDVASMFDAVDFSKDQYLRPRDIIFVPRLGDADQASNEFLALGEVSRPGFHPYSEGLDVIRAVMRMGGVPKTAQWQSARILRPDNAGGYSIVPVNLAKLFGEADMTANIPVLPGDIFFVPSAEHASRGEVFLLGAVARPGAISLPLDQDITLAKLILSTGGLAQFANDSKVRVLRKAPDGSKQTLIVDVGVILRTGAFENDVPLRDGDVVIVSEKILGI
ncbi:MAG: Polysaccharide biosynthesis/export protein [Verrucomicrobia bacterium ADurb.Bin345]|nr:MAG: Polysaccharide biosynthesis/export protein [Verrucomicrobia bacterium ADurb.Bin345]